MDELNKICVLGKGAYGRVSLVEAFRFAQQLEMCGKPCRGCRIAGETFGFLSLAGSNARRATLCAEDSFKGIHSGSGPMFGILSQTFKQSVKYLSRKRPPNSEYCNWLTEGSQRLVNGERCSAAHLENA